MPYGPAVQAEPSYPSAPHADQHLLALHALRQRQLRVALLHGRTRNWRDQRRIWPAIVVALIIVAMVIAGISVVAAFRRQQQLESAVVIVGHHLIVGIARTGADNTA